MMNRRVLLVVLFLVSLIGPVSASAATETVTIYGEEGDGNVITAPYVSPWSIQYYSEVGRNTNYVAGTINVSSGAFYTPSDYLGIIRGFLAFDTSQIPEDAVITEAKLGVYVTETLDDYDDQYGYVSVLQGFQQSTDLLVADDIDTCGDSIVQPTKGSQDVDITDLVVDQYQEFALNSVGLNWISKTGFSKLCIREGHDIENVETVKDYFDHGVWATNTWNSSGFNFASADAVDPAVRPYLEITYTVSDDEDDEEDGQYPLYTQINAPVPPAAVPATWAGDRFARATDETALSKCPTIAACGCTITSTVMLARSYGITEDIEGNDVNPGNFNQWLIENDGYNSVGNLEFAQAIKYFGVRENGIEKSFLDFDDDHLSAQETKEMVAAGTPVVSQMVAYNNDGTKVDPHFVLVTDLLLGAYRVNDPLWYNTKTLDDTRVFGYQQDYNSTITSGRNITYTAAPRAVAGAFSGSLLGVEYTESEEVVGAVVAKALSSEPVHEVSYMTAPAEFYLVTPEGAVLGFDPQTGTIHDIADGQYSESPFLSDSQEVGYQEETRESKRITASALGGGTYRMYVIGVGEGMYEFSGLVHDLLGHTHPYRFEKSTAAGLVDVYVFNVETGEIILSPVELDTLRTVIDNGVLDEGLNRFFKMWAEKIFTEIEAEKFAQALHHIETFQVLMEAKKVDSEALRLVLQQLQQDLFVQMGS